MSVIITNNKTFEHIECYKCGVEFYISADLNKNLKSNKQEFFCPNGHGQSYMKSTAEILKEKHERELREKDKVISDARREVSTWHHKAIETEKKRVRLQRELKKCNKDE